MKIYGRGGQIQSYKALIQPDFLSYQAEKTSSKENQIPGDLEDQNPGWIEPGVSDL